MRRYIKFIFAVTATLILCTSVCSCNNAPIPSHDADKVVDEVDENAEVKRSYLIFVSEEMNDNLSNSFEDATDYGFFTTTDQKVLSDAKKSVISPFTNKSIDYQYSNCSRISNKADNIGSLYSVYDLYNAEKEELTYLHDTSLLSFYFYRESIRPETPVDLDQSDALVLANDFLLKFLTKEQIDKYEAPIITEEASGTYLYIVKYVRKFAGFDTDDVIAVFISLNGNVVAYNGINIGKYDNINDVITVEEIESAKAALTNKINSMNLKNTKIRDTIITTNVEGSPYLRIDFSYENDDGFVHVETVLTNII